MSQYRKAVFAAAGAIAATVAWVIDPSVVPSQVVAGAWVVVAGVFGVANA